MTLYILLYYIVLYVIVAAILIQLVCTGSLYRNMLGCHGDEVTMLVVMRSLCT